MTKTAPRIIEVLASGPAEGGGIGQFVRYLVAENETAGAVEIVATVDPRGPGRAFATLWRLPLALLHLAWLRLIHLAAPPTLHIHMAGRLSTLRKCVVILWSRLIGFVCVLHYHEYGYAKFLNELPAPIRTAVSFCLRQCAGHIVLGPKEAEALPALIGAAPARFTITPNGVPTAMLSAPRTAPSSPAEIVFVGALSDRKGVDELLRACAGLTTSTPWRLTFCGGGDIAARSARAAELGLAGRIVFRGHSAAPQVRAALAGSRIFVLPSYAEGLSVALLEALALGCAVIATPVGEHRLVLEDDVNALVVEPGDVAALTAALARLIDDPDLCARLVEAGRATIAARFTAGIALAKIAAAVTAAHAPAQLVNSAAKRA
jgi:glycosyltransferase involved in cell wall biosynthesis